MRASERWGQTCGNRVGDGEAFNEMKPSTEGHAAKEVGRGGGRGEKARNRPTATDLVEEE